jgi:hypothetical protein
MKTRLALFPSALALSFLVGCAGEEAPAPGASAPAAAPSAPSTPKANEAPSTPPAGSAEKAPAAAPAKDKAEEKAPAPAPADDAKKSDAKPSLEGPKAEAVKLSDEELANIKKLPAEEHAAALA